MLFAIQATGYAPTGWQPEVRVVPAGEIAELFDRVNGPGGGPGGGLAGRHGREVGAFYLPGERTIYLNAAIGDPDERDSLLVHELVHELQIADGAQLRVPCEARLEAEAYAVQARFLRRRGRDDLALPYSLAGLLMGDCRPEPQPG
ncbi:hypothetical protein [Tistlia consotensis]|uniref:hypothetical protein n=1 Tax=Tistlia consotensis TaxID=1321365 RepID=UPI00117F0082|nr:hypothetical protein [Tistlia consotensis]